MIQININLCLHTVKWLNNSIWLVDRIPTSTITLDKSGPGSNGLEGFNCGEGSYPSAKMQSMYSIAPVNWADYLYLKELI